MKIKHRRFQLVERIPPPTPNPVLADRHASEMMAEAMDATDELIARSALGNQEAIAALVCLCKFSTNSLNAILVAHLKPVARLSPQWPAMVSLNPETTRAVQRLLEAIELGAKSELACHKNTNWRRDDLMTRVAMDLIQVIQQNKSMFPILENPPQWVIDASNLARLSKATAGQWAKVAKAALLEEIPHPESHKDFKTVAQSEKEPARRRARILTLLVRCVRQMASNADAA